MGENVHPPMNEHLGRADWSERGHWQVLNIGMLLTLVALSYKLDYIILDA